MKGNSEKDEFSKHFKFIEETMLFRFSSLRFCSSSQFYMPTIPAETPEEMALFFNPSEPCVLKEAQVIGYLKIENTTYLITSELLGAGGFGVVREAIIEDRSGEYKTLKGYVHTAVKIQNLLHKEAIEKPRELTDAIKKCEEEYTTKLNKAQDILGLHFSAEELLPDQKTSYIDLFNRVEELEEEIKVLKLQLAKAEKDKDKEIKAAEASIKKETALMNTAGIVCSSVFVLSPRALCFSVMPEYKHSLNAQLHSQRGNYNRSQKADWKESAFNARLDLAIDLLYSVHKLHSLPIAIAHCDIKPENVFINQSGRLQLADFGLAITEKEKYATAGTQGYIPQYYKAREKKEFSVAIIADRYATLRTIYYPERLSIFDTERFKKIPKVVQDLLMMPPPESDEAKKWCAAPERTEETELFLAAVLILYKEKSIEITLEDINSLRSDIDKQNELVKRHFDSLSEFDFLDMPESSDDQQFMGSMEFITQINLALIEYKKATTVTGRLFSSRAQQDPHDKTLADDLKRLIDNGKKLPPDMLAHKLSERITLFQAISRKENTKMMCILIKRKIMSKSPTPEAKPEAQSVESEPSNSGSPKKPLA